MMPITFNIVGCCVCRDIFRICPDDNFKVEKFNQFSNPVSFLDFPLNQNRLALEDLTFLDWSNFVKRNVCLDFNKSVIDYIFSHKSDYLILDLCELRFYLYKITTKTKEEFFITKTRYAEILIENAEKIEFLNDAIIEEIDATDWQIQKCLDQYIEIIKQYYNANQVILIKNYPVYKHMDDSNHSFFEFNSSSNSYVCNKLKKAYNYFEYAFKDINVIEFPNHVIGTTNHLWGKDQLHFTDHYYEYLYYCLKNITENDDKNRLVKLWNKYSLFFKDLTEQKRMEYYIYSSNKESLLLNSSLDEDKNQTLQGWEISLSQNSTFDIKEKILNTGESQNCWAILSQTIDKDKFLGKTLCFTVKYKTYGNSNLNITFRKYKSSNIEYCSTKVVSSNFTTIDNIVYKIPDDTNDFDKIDVAVYLNSPNSKAELIEVKLEVGEFSSLFNTTCKIKKIALLKNRTISEDAALNEKFTNVANNSGNIVYWEAIQRLFDVTIVPFSEWQSLSDYDAVIITDLCWIQENTEYKYLEIMFDYANIPFIPLSIGLQHNSFNPDFKLAPSLVRLLQKMQNKATLAVRGDFTASILRKYGITKIIVTGCPSMYYWNNRNLKITSNKKIEKSLCNFKSFGNILSDKDLEMLQFFMKNKLLFVEQTSGKFNINHCDNKKLFKTLSNYLDENTLLDFNYSSWSDKIKNYDFSIGCRFHGNIIALHNNIKALFITIDSRTQEMIDLFKLPYIKACDFNKTKTVQEYFNLADYSEFNENYPRMYDRFIKFVNDNNLVLSKKATPLIFDNK